MSISPEYNDFSTGYEEARDLLVDSVDFLFDQINLHDGQFTPNGKKLTQRMGLWEVGRDGERVVQIDGPGLYYFVDRNRPYLQYISMPNPNTYVAITLRGRDPLSAAYCGSRIGYPAMKHAFAQEVLGVGSRTYDKVQGRLVHATNTAVWNNGEVRTTRYGAEQDTDAELEDITYAIDLLDTLDDPSNPIAIR